MGPERTSPASRIGAYNTPNERDSRTNNKHYNAIRRNAANFLRADEIFGLCQGIGIAEPGGLVLTCSNGNLKILQGARCASAAYSITLGTLKWPFSRWALKESGETPDATTLSSRSASAGSGE